MYEKDRLQVESEIGTCKLNGKVKVRGSAETEIRKSYENQRNKNEMVESRTVMW